MRSALFCAALLCAGPALSSASQPLDRILVVVNDGVILQSELDQAMDGTRKQLADRHISLPPDDVLRSQVLDHLILTRVQTERAQETGIRVDDRELNEVLTNIASQ